MKAIYKIFIISICTALCDIPYLYYNGGKFKNMISMIQNKEFNLRLIYLPPIYIMIGTLIYMGLFYDNNKYSNMEFILRAFLIGMCTYGIYDFTNYATISGWDFNFMFMDMLWGGLLFTIVSLISKQIFKKII